MIERIVRMSFREEEVEGFIELFDATSSLIRSFPGCEHLELWQDPKDETVFMTYSKWRSEEDLEEYRTSELFSEVWAKTKARFKESSRAFSARNIRTL